MINDNLGFPNLADDVRSINYQDFLDALTQGKRRFGIAK